MIYYSGYFRLLFTQYLWGRTVLIQLKSERYIINKMYNKEIEKYAKDILESDNFLMTKKHIQQKI